jgi:hypothetical protein
MTFNACNGITLTGIKAGHSVIGEYECDKGVVYFFNTNNISVTDCYFYGSGALGIETHDCDAAEIRDTTITDCSLRAVDINDSTRIHFNDCKFVHNRAYADVIFARSSDIVFTNCEISGNKQLLSSVVDSYVSSVLLDGCDIVDNVRMGEPGLSAMVFYEESGKTVSLKNCIIEKSNFDDYWGENVTDLGGNTLI